MGSRESRSACTVKTAPRGTVTVRRALIWREKGGWYFGEMKTARSRRAIPLPASTVRALTEYLRRHAEERLKLGPAVQ